MFRCLAILICASSLQLASAMPYKKLVIVPREGWGARPPTEVVQMPTPVPYVVIHHTYIPGACNTSEECIEAMKWMQDYHQLNRSWFDIGYTFCIGGDGNVYTGRGWGVEGAHAPGYNNISIGICFIGDFRTELPNEDQLEAVKLLIEYGIQQNQIVADYRLLGHRQVRETECPGDRLFNEISQWDHFYNITKSSHESRVLQKKLPVKGNNLLSNHIDEGKKKKP